MWRSIGGGLCAGGKEEETKYLCSKVKKVETGLHMAEWKERWEEGLCGWVEWKAFMLVVR